MTVQLIKDWACFGGRQKVFSHQSSATNTSMDVAVYLPPQAAQGGKLPVLVFLSGLTCTWENFTTKAGAQRYAAQHGIILVMPDTSPRGDNVPNDTSYDLGQGAGFYVNATQSPWSAHFQMWSYITEELPALLPQLAPMADVNRLGISGHSMGGHGALIAALRHPELYKSVSALSPIVAPSQVPWGEKAFTAYLGTDRAAWLNYDATSLVASRKITSPILIDQGMDDEFLATQLKPDLFAAACAQAGVSVNLRMQPGYDHSYYFIASVIGEHIAHHAAELASV